MDSFKIRTYLLNLLNNTPQLIKLKLENNYEYLKKRDLYLELENYVDEFIEKPNKNKFFIIPGLRGVGKTTILYQLYDYLVNTRKISQNRILFLDLELLKYEDNLNLRDYFNVFIKEINEEYYLTTEPLFIFVDESQYDLNWDSAGKLIYDEHVNVFIIFTGSNALNLTYSADAARRLKRRELYPLNFAEYLEIKHSIELDNKIEESIFSLLFNGEVTEAQRLEKEVQIKIHENIQGNINLEWENYLQFGNLPYGITENKIEIAQESLDMIDRIIEKDFLIIDSMNDSTRKKSYPLTKQLAMQKPGEISYTFLANILDINAKTVKSLLEILEKTELIFHIESYGSVSKRIRSSSEYYFLATQFKAAYFLNEGDVTNEYKQYLGILLENHVASILYKLKQKRSDGFGLYYDSKKGGVDFILKSFNNKAIPVEVGVGNKNKKQITRAIKQYNSDYGIVISNKTDCIVREDNVIFVPVQTFTLI